MAHGVLHEGLQQQSRNERRARLRIGGHRDAQPLLEASLLDEAIGLRQGELRRRWQRWREANVRFP